MVTTEGHKANVTLHVVLHVLAIGRNLMSVSQLAHAGASVSMIGTKCHMEVGGHQFIIVERNGLYPVVQAKKVGFRENAARNVAKPDATASDIVKKKRVDTASAAESQEIIPAEQAQIQHELQEWHQRFGHAGVSTIFRTSK